MENENNDDESVPTEVTTVLGSDVTTVEPEDGASRRWFLKSSVMGAASLGGLSGVAAAAPESGGTGLERIAVSDREIVTLVDGIAHRRLFKLVRQGANAGLVQYVEDPINRATTALQRSVSIDSDGRISIPGLSFTDLIVRSDPFIVAPGYDYGDLDDGSTTERHSIESTSDQTVSTSATPSVITRYGRFRQIKSSCKYSNFSGYTHKFKGAKFTLSKTARDVGFGALSAAVCFVLTGGLAGTVICGAITSFILSVYPGGRNFTIGGNDTDLGLPGFKSPFTSLRVAAKYGASLGETVPIGLSPGHVERELDAEVLFPSGYTP